jgi:hypothetical protein
MMDERAFWNEVRRSVLTLIRALTQDRPAGRYTLEVRIVERSTTDLS